VKIFNTEIKKLFKKLKNKEFFSFSKYADGEWAIIQGHDISNGEFKFSKNESRFYRQQLIDSFKFKNNNYYVGISCECCQGKEHYRMKEFCEQDDEHLTFANIFVNSNYEFYKDKFISEYQNFDIHLIANEKSKIDNLPFKVEKFYPIGHTAFINNYLLIDHIKSLNLNDKLFLFCAGPFGNMLAHQLYQNNPNNIYLDIGSTLNPWLQSEGFKRGYYNNNKFYKYQTCIWN
jgi:hypothetical protein